MATDIFPPDTSTPVGQVRVLINDTVEKPYDGPNTTARYRISDDSIQAHIAVARDRLYAGAANALRAMAANEVLISKVIRTEDLSTNGAAVSTELRLLAREMDRLQKDEDDALAYEDAFEIVNFEYPYTNREW